MKGGSTHSKWDLTPCCCPVQQRRCASTADGIVKPFTWSLCRCKMSPQRHHWHLTQPWEEAPRQVWWKFVRKVTCVSQKHARVFTWEFGVECEKKSPSPSRTGSFRIKILWFPHKNLHDRGQDITTLECFFFLFKENSKIICYSWAYTRILVPKGPAGLFDFVPVPVLFRYQSQKPATKQLQGFLNTLSVFMGSGAHGDTIGEGYQPQQGRWD